MLRLDARGLTVFSTEALKKARAELDTVHVSHHETRMRAEHHLLKEMLDKEIEGRGENEQAPEPAQEQAQAQRDRDESFIQGAAAKAGRAK